MDCATNSSHFELVVELIKNYADGFHHAKEEKLLFPILVKKGFSNEAGPVAVMLHDHAEGRNFVKNMAAAIVRYKNDDESALPEIYRNMQGYIDLLRTHIAKENNVLFRMADHMISVEEQLVLQQQFDDVETIEFGKAKIQKFITDIEGLEVVYLKSPNSQKGAY